MKLKIYRLRSTLANEDIVKEFNDAFLRDLDIECVEEDEDQDNSYVLIESGGTEALFVKFLPSLHPHIVILTSSENNSLPASLEILAYLINKGYSGEILHGDDYNIKKRLETLKTAKKATNDLVRLGSVGKPSDWLIASSVEENVLKKKINANITYITYDEFISEFEKKNYDLTSRIQELLDINSSKDLQDALFVYGALKRLIKKYDLEAITIRCFDLIGLKKTTACIALALLNEEGIPATCEGDQTTMVGMYLVQKHLHKPSFQTNPSWIDEKRNEIIFAHCTLPFNMTSSYTLTTHFESSLGVAIQGIIPEQDVTIFRLAQDLNKAFVRVGKIDANLNNSRRCRTQIKVNFSDNISDLLTNPLGNHHLIILGNHQKDLVNFLQKIGINCE